VESVEIDDRNATKHSSEAAMANHFSYVRKNRIGIAALSILLGGLIIHAQEKQARVAPNASCKVVQPRGYSAIFTDKAIKIDGKLDDPAWLEAAWTEDFGDIQGEARPAPRYRTRAKMSWDADYFYVGARLEEPHVWGTLTKHDSVIFQDNDFEIFIDPDGDNHQYLELEINALNTEWDLRLVKAYRDGGPALNEWEVPGLKTAVAVEGTLNDPTDQDTAWTVEWAIPWKVLAEFAARRSPPAPGDTWRVNFSRVEWRHTIEKDGKYKKIPGFPEENWVWSPQGRIDMHRPELWGHVRFVKTADEAKKPVVAEDQAARWWLLEVYDAQKGYIGREKKYATTLEQLGLKPPAESGWKFEMKSQPDGSNYSAKITLDRPGRKPLTLEMQSDSKITRTPSWDDDSH
jgi:hypothetical protein